MTDKSYLDNHIALQDIILKFIDESPEVNFRVLQDAFKKFNIQNDKNETKLFIYFISKVSNHHHRGPLFFSKIEEILNYFKEDIKNIFSNFEIFEIFKKNKRILLFLIEEGIIVIDYDIYKIFTSNKEFNYHEYFSPELKIFENEHQIEEEKADIKNSSKSCHYKNDENSLEELGFEYDENSFEYIDDFYRRLDIKKNERLEKNRNKTSEKYNYESDEFFKEKRKIGENDSYICELIRNDSIDDFIIYVTKNNINLNSSIPNSIFETNVFIIKQRIKENISLIEYAVFFGSYQIFNYLRLNNILIGSLLLIYSVHGRNPELIHLLEENISCPQFLQCYKESIKCHHNELAEYFLNMNIDAKLITSLKYYSFENISKFFDSETFSIFDLCKYDYFNFLKNIAKENKNKLGKTDMIFNYFIK